MIAVLTADQGSEPGLEADGFMRNYFWPIFLELFSFFFQIIDISEYLLIGMYVCTA